MRSRLWGIVCTWDPYPAKAEQAHYWSGSTVDSTYKVQVVKYFRHCNLLKVLVYFIRSGQFFTSKFFFYPSHVRMLPFNDETSLEL